ncbi:hypothetical protein [Cetobacterium sp.]|uniref:hypothetical protein n=1 Tax=Cetobacterium sp. TaxID=2071632 RepID=UPI003F2E9017
MRLVSFFFLCIGLNIFIALISGREVKKVNITLEYIISGVLYNILAMTLSWYLFKISLPELITYLTKL